jgi:hypothetical protein
MVEAEFGALARGDAEPGGPPTFPGNAARPPPEGFLRLVDLIFFLLGQVWILDMLFPL